MSTWYPLALRKPIQHNFGGARARTRAVILHVDAGAAASLQGWFNNPSSGASSHFYVRYDGVVEQYVDADLTAWTQRAGNASCVGIETQGLGDGPWTSAQFASLVTLVRWLCERYGLPKASMGNSLPSSRGIGYHRMGIDPWRVSGGEVWGPRGKVCPGDDRVAQFPALVAAVASGAPVTTEDDMPDMNEFLNTPAFDGGPTISEVLKRSEAVFQGMFYGSTAGGVKYSGVLPILAADQKAAAGLRAAVDAVPLAIWNVNVTRDGQSIPVIQELADAKSAAVAARGEIAGLRAAIDALSSGSGLTADQIQKAARAGAEGALKDGVKVTIAVPKEG